MTTGPKEVPSNRWSSVARPLRQGVSAGATDGSRIDQHVRRDERGAAALEFVVIVPALGLLIALMIGAARVWYAQTTVDQIAAASARAASLAMTADDARSRAQQVARDQASTTGLNCSGLRVDIDVHGFQVPVGQPAAVRVHVACSVPLADLIVPGWPSTWQLQADGSSALDRYRRRG